ncbi:hypothetical protein ABZ345_05225 [Lentzea sp. NPDC005914]|uniref:hypothetical protein n=1 Tax=Lentzea sp. NPDC005914 TaxID=3154572 RepID=UPI0033E71C67
MVLLAVLAWQMRLQRYTPIVHWLAVVVLSVTGTLYTDVRTGDLLAIVFGVWWARERTLSIRCPTWTPPRRGSPPVLVGQPGRQLPFMA